MAIRVVGSFELNFLEGDLTIELDVAGQEAQLRGVVARLADAGIMSSVFIDADLRQVEAAARIGARVCEIHTAVQSRRLYSVNRLRRAERFLAVLRPLLFAAQGQVAPDELRQRIDAARQTAFANAAPPVIGQSPQ